MTDLNEISELKGHKIVAWSVRSIIPRLEELERLIEGIKPDIIGLCETWLSSSIDDDQIKIPGYILTSYDRTAKSGKHGGGRVMFYHRSSIKCTHMSELNVCEPFLDCIWLRLTLTNTHPIYYCMV